MRTTLHIYSVVIYSCLAFLAMVPISIQSHHANTFGSSTIVRSWTSIILFLIFLIGMATFCSLMSIHKRLSNLESRSPGGTNQG